MFIDEEPPRKKEGPQPRVLDKLSPTELEEYILWLEAEITRTRDDMKRKKSATAAAESFFRK
jgi:uncharacterized small protein (DUF1192 family)